MKEGMNGRGVGEGKKRVRGRRGRDREENK